MLYRFIARQIVNGTVYSPDVMEAMGWAKQGRLHEMPAYKDGWDRLRIKRELEREFKEENPDFRYDIEVSEMVTSDN